MKVCTHMGHFARCHQGIREASYDNAFGLENYTIEEFVKALGNAEEDAFLNNSDAGQPQCLFVETGCGTIAKTVTTLTADDILNLIYALKMCYRKDNDII